MSTSVVHLCDSFLYVFNSIFNFQCLFFVVKALLDTKPDDKNIQAVVERLGKSN